MDTLNIVNEVMRFVFDDDTIEASRDTTAHDVDGWDSLSHVNLIIGLEDRFDISFTQKESLHFKNIGELVDSIDKKINNVN